MLYMCDPAHLATADWTKEWHLSHRWTKCFDAEEVFTKGIEPYLFSQFPFQSASVTVSIYRIKLAKLEVHRLSWSLLAGEIEAIVIEMRYFRHHSNGTFIGTSS